MEQNIDILQDARHIVALLQASEMGGGGGGGLTLFQLLARASIRIHTRDAFCFAFELRVN